MGQQPRELNPNVSAGHLFGAELRHARNRHGLSLARLCELYEHAGRRVNAGYLANVEQGERFPDDRRFAETADTALHTNGLLGRLWDFADTERRGARDAARQERKALLDLAAGSLAPILSGDVVFLPYATDAGTVAYMRMTRRAFLASGGMAATGAAAGSFDPDELDRLTRALEQPHRSDPHVADYFARMLDLHRTHDFVVDPALRVGPVVQQVGVLDGLGRDARGPARKALRSVQAEYAGYAGWLYQEIGSTSAAVSWTEKATAWAQASGNYQLVTFTATRQSNIAWWDGGYDVAAEFAASAAASPWPVPPGLASLAAQYEAAARAAVGDAAACDATLDQAASLLSARDASDEDQIYWARRHDWNHFRDRQADCAVDLGRAKEAIALLEPEFAIPGATGRGTYNVGRMVILGLSYAKDHQSDVAVQFGMRALDSLDLALTTPLNRSLRRLDRALDEWATDDRVQRFRARLDEKSRALESR